MADEEVLEEDGKKKKKKKKKDKGGSFDATVSDEGAMYTDAYEEDEEGGGIMAAFVVLFIVIIWLAILALLVKLDVGGFGSGVLYPILKDTPVLNKILPDNIDEELESLEYNDMDEAIAEIERLREENTMLRDKASGVADADEIATLKEEIRRLQTFENTQVEFQKLKTEFYEEVVFGENAPSVEEYKKYYTEIDPDNAEYIYRQVIQQLETEGELADFVKAYSEMKPKQAAGIFNLMVDNLDLVAKILNEMDPQPRAKILGAMDTEVASQLTKIMDPDY